MMYKVHYILFCLLTVSPGITAQVFIEQGPSGTTRDGAVIVYGMDGTNRRIRYDQIKGSPFYNDEWRKASLLDTSGKSLGRHDVKLNIVTNEVHFLDKKGMEVAANDVTVSQVVFVDTVAGQQKFTLFRNDHDAIIKSYKNNRKYAQEMNTGYASLLKVVVRTGLEKDSLFATRKAYFFSDRIDYFLRVNKKVEKIKKLKRDDIFVYLPDSDPTLKWAEKNGLKMNREEDVIKTIDYYNAQRIAQGKQ